ncbi:MAG: hypothetical protein U1F98_12945 [Verrucomicrobiota bacterium]
METIVDVGIHDLDGRAAEIRDQHEIEIAEHGRGEDGPCAAKDESIETLDRIGFRPGEGAAVDLEQAVKGENEIGIGA